MHHLFNVLNHLQPIRRWAREHGAELQLDAETFRLTLRLRDGRNLTLLPRFMIRQPNGHAAYTTTFVDDCRFCGWLPYEVKRWPLAADKLLFKQYCREHGLRVPAAWGRDDPALAPDFIIKPSRGSWGHGIRGPFRDTDLPRLRQELPEGAFFEQFIVGRPTKIWFWNDKPVAMETVDPPMLVADGRRSLAQMAAQPRGNFDKGYTLESSAQMLAWQGWSAESVPPAGQVVALGFLYATPYDRVEVMNRDCLRAQGEELRAQLVLAGKVLMNGIPTAERLNTLFTVDGVVDVNERLWLLEINCHPIVHPMTYPWLLESVTTQEDDRRLRR